MIPLRSAEADLGAVDREAFPFSVPIVATLDRLEFSAPVTFLVGENGSGKSTLLEALAVASERVAVGSDPLEVDETLTAARALAACLRLTWNRRTAKGFFLRAEDFFGYARRIAELAAESQRELAAIEIEYEDRSDYARQLARGPHARSLAEIRSLYGDGLDAQSHGESFLKLFGSRLVPQGLYLLDEPEVPLSPLRQLALLGMLCDAIDEGSQFVVATHSPILLACPGAEIWSCDGERLETVPWDELEHVTLTRSFLNDPERYLRRL